MAWIVDNAHTHVGFSVKHMMISTVRGEFTKFSGTLNLNEQQPELSTAEGTIDVTSISTRDANRDAHLRSADFFDAEKYPTISFRSAKVTQTGEGAYEVSGPLTIKDVTREVTWTVNDEGRGKDPWGNVHWGFAAQTSFSRKDFGLNWNVALETGGWLVGDLIKVAVDLEAVYQQEAPAGEGKAE